MGMTVRKHIVFPSELVELAEFKADRLGFSLAEYIRFLLAKDVKKCIDEIPYVDIELEKSIGRGLRDYKKGDYEVLESEKDIKAFMKQFGKSSRKTE